REPHYPLRAAAGPRHVGECVEPREMWLTGAGGALYHTLTPRRRLNLKSAPEFQFDKLPARHVKLRACCSAVLLFCKEHPLRPFLKWVVGKYRPRHFIRQHLPEGRRLIEPFAGSAAIFLNTEFDRYLIADHNPDLINLSLYVQREGENFIAYC